MKKWLILALALLFFSGCSFSKVRDWIEEMEWERDDETVSIVHSTIVAWGSDKCGLRTAAESLNRCRIDMSIGTVGGHFFVHVSRRENRILRRFCYVRPRGAHESFCSARHTGQC